MARAVALVLALGLGFAIFIVFAVTPRPLPAEAPAAEFSAARAMVDVRAMGSRPHPVGSAADAAVRDILVRRMRDLGLNPVVQRDTAFAVRGEALAGATVENVVGVLPGRDRRAPALAIMAHHDSVAGSPGAADDTAGVAAALEIVRAIRVRGVPARDVMLVATDGEEAGLLGAKAFFQDSPLAAHVGYVLNLEARGGGGRALMFETAPANGADIALYRRTAAEPLSNALTVFVYHHLPNSTDFAEALAHGKVGLNYAFIGRQFDYHSPSSTPDALDQGALQHMGAQVMPTAVALAFGPLPRRAPDVVYGNVLGGLTVAYPAAFGWLLVGASAVLIGMAAVGAWALPRRRGDASPAPLLAPIDVARGVGASLYVVALCGALLELARRATGVAPGWIAYRRILAQFPLFEAMMLLVALAGLLASVAFAARGRSRAPAAASVLAAGLAASLFGGFDPAGAVLGGAGALLALAGFGRPTGVAGSTLGVLLTALAASVVVQVLAPTAGALVTWPLLAAAAAAALSAAGADGGPAALVNHTIVGAFVLAWLGGLFHQLLQGLDLPIVAIAPVWLAALVIWPLAWPGPGEPARLAPAAVLAALGLSLAAIIGLDDPWTSRRPDSVEPVFVVDPAARRAWRASLIPPDAWARRVMTAEGGRLGRLRLPFHDTPVAAAPATFRPADPPLVVRSVAADGTVTLTAAFHPGAERLWLAIRSPARIRNIGVDGKASDLAVTPGEVTIVQWTPPEPFTVSFHAPDPARVDVAAGEVLSGWRADRPLPPTPPTDQLWDLAGATLVIGRPAATP